MAEGAPLTVAEVARELSAQVVGADALDQPVTGAQVCDLLSHVMARGREGQVWVTIQTHPNIVAVAALARLAAIILAHGMQPEEETVMRAEDEGMPLLLSEDSAYLLAGKLYTMGVR
jgi:predicted transcriptional regulator